MAALQHLAGLADQRPHALAALQRRALLDPIFGPLGGAAEGPEGGRAGIEVDRIILPQAGGDHAAVEIDDALQLGALETDLRFGPSSFTRAGELEDGAHSGPAPVADGPRAFEARPSIPVALLDQLGDPRAQLLDLALEDFELLRRRIEILGAGVP